MGYILNKDQQDLVALARDFAEKKVAPFVHELDEAKEPVRSFWIFTRKPSISVFAA